MLLLELSKVDMLSRHSLYFNNMEQIPAAIIKAAVETDLWQCDSSGWSNQIQTVTCARQCRVDKVC